MTNASETTIQPCGAALSARCFNGEPGCPTHPNLPRRTPGRAHRLAALDHLRTWCENEDVPSPTYVQAHSTITREDEVDQATRFAMVDAFAARHEVKVVDGRGHYFASVTVYDGDAGVTITYSLFAQRDVEPAL